MKNSDAYINEDVVNAVDHIVDDEFLDDSYTIGTVDEQEERHISELWRISDNMDKTELAAICGRTIRKYPMIYLHVLAEYIFELLKGRGKEK